MPLFNDEQYVAAALSSCITQTEHRIEIICVDDASTDQTSTIVRNFAARDSRIRLIQQSTNSSAFQARRIGIAAANAAHILFLDGDDELDPRAVETTLELIADMDADVVGFGVEVVAEDGHKPDKFERSLQPQHDRLDAPRILPTLFPPGKEANGHIWKYLFAASLLQEAYSALPRDSRFYRANDLPITMLALSHAKRYVSTIHRLYRYHFRRGTSGHAIETFDQFKFIASGIEPISAIGDAIREIAQSSEFPEQVLHSYTSARLHMIGNALRNAMLHTNGALQMECLRYLQELAGTLDVVRAGAGFVPSSQRALSRSIASTVPDRKGPASILITSANLGTGGLQGVLLEHAGLLAALGFRVTIAVMGTPPDDVVLPPNVEVTVVSGRTNLEKVDSWVQLCHTYDVDVILDHHILYNTYWPWLVMAARAVGVPTIGWIHNFALRPLFEGTTRASFLVSHLPLLLEVVVLSPTDVAYWKLRGIARVRHIPNPPSALARSAQSAGGQRKLDGKPIELAWWGRFDPQTKQVGDLLKVATELKRMGIAFQMRVIGANSRRLTAESLREDVAALELADVVDIRGSEPPQELLGTLASSDLFVMTSAIEGSPLTIVEAQAFGMPTVMYELPWVTTAREDSGVRTVPPGDPAALARAIAEIVVNPEVYSRMSRDARRAAAVARSLDYGGFLEDLLRGRTDSPEAAQPSLADAELLLEWSARFEERNARHALRLRDANTQLREDLARARREVKSLKNGPSFRIGRLITFIPRIVRTILDKE